MDNDVGHLIVAKSTQLLGILVALRMFILGFIGMAVQRKQIRPLLEYYAVYIIGNQREKSTVRKEAQKKAEAEMQTGPLVAKSSSSQETSRPDALPDKTGTEPI